MQIPVKEPHIQINYNIKSRPIELHTAKNTSSFVESLVSVLLRFKKGPMECPNSLHWCMIDKSEINQWLLFSRTGTAMTGLIRPSGMGHQTDLLVVCCASRSCTSKRDMFAAEDRNSVLFGWLFLLESLSLSIFFSSHIEHCKVFWECHLILALQRKLKSPYWPQHWGAPWVNQDTVNKAIQTTKHHWRVQFRAQFNEGLGSVCYLSSFLLLGFQK